MGWYCKSSAGANQAKRKESHSSVFHINALLVEEMEVEEAAAVVVMEEVAAVPAEATPWW